MNDLLDCVLEAHGGIDRWNEFTQVVASIVTGGGLWSIKGLAQDAAPRQMTVATKEEWASVTPYGKPEWRTAFTPKRIAIETLTGEVVQERIDPREVIRWPHDEHAVGHVAASLFQRICALDISHDALSAYLARLRG